MVFESLHNIRVVDSPVPSPFSRAGFCMYFAATLAAGTFFVLQHESTLQEAPPREPVSQGQHMDLSSYLMLSGEQPPLYMGLDVVADRIRSMPHETHTFNLKCKGVPKEYMFSAVPLRDFFKEMSYMQTPGAIVVVSHNYETGEDYRVPMPSESIDEAVIQAASFSAEEVRGLGNYSPLRVVWTPPSRRADRAIIKGVTSIESNLEADDGILLLNYGHESSGF